jgi:sulfotransferase
LGLAYNALKDAVTLGYLDRMLFVDYNKLMSAPKSQLKRIYEFLEEPYFEHDLGNIEQQGQYNWRPHKLPGLHDVRPEFKKEFKSARQILGDVYGQYDQPEPWSGWT